MPRAHQNPPKQNTQATFEQNENFHLQPRIKDSQFLRRTLYLSPFSLLDLAKTFLLTRFEKNLVTFLYKESMVSGSEFHF